MKLRSGIALLTIIALLSFKKAGNGEAILRMMYNKYAGKWHSGLTFKQTTEVYRNDSLKRTQTWREAILYPDKLRIDIEPIAGSNTIFFRGDSTYRITNGQLKSAVKNENDLIFLLGGLYFMPFDKTIAKLKDLGYDVSKLHEDSWKGQPVYVIGATTNDEKVSQLWIDKKNLFLVRMLEYKKDSKEEAIFDDHVKIGNGWSETKCTFYINDKLVQIEKYYDSKAAPTLDPRFFDPNHYIKAAD